MSPGALVLLSTSLAVDATAVAAVHGLATPALLPRHFLGVGALFGGFHMVMPLTGWLLGEQLGGTLPVFQPWLAFGVLATVGGKMAWDGLKGSGRDASHGGWFTLRNLLLLSLVTSLDALAVGVALPVLEAPFVASLLTIGVTTATLSSAGLLVGRRAGALLGRRLDLAGGLVIAGLGVKVLAQQL